MPSILSPRMAGRGCGRYGVRAAAVAGWCGVDMSRIVSLAPEEIEGANIFQIGRCRGVGYGWDRGECCRCPRVRAVCRMGGGCIMGGAGIGYAANGGIVGGLVKNWMSPSHPQRGVRCVGGRWGGRHHLPARSAQRGCIMVRWAKACRTPGVTAEENRLEISLVGRNTP